LNWMEQGRHWKFERNVFSQSNSPRFPAPGTPTSEKPQGRDLGTIIKPASALFRLGPNAIPFSGTTGNAKNGAIPLPASRGGRERKVSLAGRRHRESLSIGAPWGRPTKSFPLPLGLFPSGPNITRNAHQKLGLGTKNGKIYQQRQKKFSAHTQNKKAVPGFSRLPISHQRQRGFLGRAIAAGKNFFRTEKKTIFPRRKRRKKKNHRGFPQRGTGHAAFQARKGGGGVTVKKPTTSDLYMFFAHRGTFLFAGPIQISDVLGPKQN